MEVKMNTAYKKLSETVVHTGAWTFAFGKNIDKKVRGVRNFPGMLWR